MQNARLLISDSSEDEVLFLRSEVERLTSELRAIHDHAAALESLAHEDPLTGLLNRRGFMRELTRAIAFADRYKTSAALLVADLDRFKPINDRYGHEVGDQALKCISELLRGNVRRSDAVARLGGDEFAIILWQVDETGAAGKAAALEAAVESQDFLCKGRKFDLALSIGLTMLAGGDTPESAVARADVRMYRRKADRRRKPTR
jgi:diguanylate cyclase (GGDEF)-like protein